MLVLRLERCMRLSCLLAGALLLTACGDDDDSTKGGGGKSHHDAGTDAGQDAIGSAGSAGHGGSGVKPHPGNDAGGGGSGGLHSTDPGDIGGSLGNPTAKAKWIVFIYGHSDHSLSNSL